MTIIKNNIMKLPRVLLVCLVAATSCDGEAFRGARSLEGFQSSCICNGMETLCDNAIEEEFCSCANTSLVCTDPFEDCHCHGADVHCNDASLEQACHCDGDSIHCELSELKQTSTTSKPWASAILAAFLVNLVTLIGVIFIAGGWLRDMFCPNCLSNGEQLMMWTHLLIPMFACGALLATTFFLVLPEGLALIQSDFLGDGHEGHNHRRFLQEEDDHSGEAAATWRFGTCVLGGFLIPVLSHLIFPHEDLHDHGTAKSSSIAQVVALDSKQPEMPEAEVPVNDTTELEVDDKNISKHESRTAETEEETEASRKKCCTGTKYANPSLIASIFLGDFFHNFADGVFIGTAFSLCDTNLAITITAATIFHELAQEVADYFLLVHHCGMSNFGALALNFACGLSIMLGAIIVLAADLSNAVIGIILCIGGGVYLHVAIAECLGLAERYEKRRKQKAYGVLAFVVGVVPIGLVLLNHEHCGGH